MPERIQVLRVASVRNLKVSVDPDQHLGIACVMDFVFGKDDSVTFGLTTEAFRTLVHALVDNMPPSDRATGRS
jgi:hypothetical protein